MNAITQVITQQLAGGAVSTIAQRFGVSETTAIRIRTAVRWTTFNTWPLSLQVKREPKDRIRC
jgi:hypothetical protein